MHCVIGNILDKRYDEVLIIDSKEKKLLQRQNGDEELETVLVSEIARMHEQYIEN